MFKQTEPDSKKTQPSDELLSSEAPSAIGVTREGCALRSDLNQFIDQSIGGASGFESAFEAQAQRVSIIPDLKAQLSYSVNDLDVYSFYLTQITGSKVRYLLGKSFEAEDERLPLDELIPIEQRQIHHTLMLSVLREGASSKHWDSLFRGMMSRVIKIISPGEQVPRFVIIKMRFHTTQVIHVEFIDQTAIYAVADKAGLVTHNLRALMTAGVSNIKDRALPLTREEFVRFTPVELGDYFDRQKEKDETSLGLFTEGHHWCASSRESFLPQSIIKEHMRERKNDVDVDMELLDFTRTIQAVTEGSELFCEGNTHAFSDRDTLDVLKQFLVNLIKNATNAGATKINVTGSREPSKLTWKVIDNGPGMPPGLLSDFFKRPFPARVPGASSKAIGDSRGEGTLMSNQQWLALGGDATVTSPNGALSGTTFTLSICNHHSFFQQDVDLLSELDRLNRSKPNGIILLVDDSLSIMKLLLKNVTSIIDPTYRTGEKQPGTLQAVTTQNWQITGFVIEKRGGLYVICASNGRIAYEIVKRCSVRATITDHEMPEMTGLDLIKSIRERERSLSFQRMGIALNSALLESESESGSAAVQALKIGEEIDCFLPKTKQPTQFGEPSPLNIFLRDFLLASNPEESISSKVGGSTQTPLGLTP